MKLFSLPWEHIVFNVIGVLLCAAILVSAICRLNASPPRMLKITAPQVFYICVALWALGTLVDLLRGAFIGFHNAAVGVAFMTHLFMTYEYWEQDDPISRPLDWGAFRC